MATTAGRVLQQGLAGTSVFTAIVVGGGVAGLSAAIGLSKRHSVKLLTGRADSAAATYGRSLEATGLDPYIGLWTGGLECAEALCPGLLNELEKHGRGCLVHLVLVEYTYGLFAYKTVFAQCSGVTVHTTCGREVAGDLLVGADGRCSAVRTQMLSTGAGHDNTYPLQYRGYLVYRGVCPSASPTQELHASFQSWGGQCRFAAVPVKEGQSWFATVQGPPIAKDEALDDFEAAATGLMPAVMMLNATILNASIFQCSCSYCRHRSSFPDTSLGRVILIGDAAYCLDPVLAQGAGVALEDALELSTIMDTLDDDASDEVPGALAFMAKRRRHRAHTLARLSNVSQWLAHLDPQGVRAGLRDMVMKGLPSAVTGRVFDAALKLSANRGCVEKAGPLGK
ncbi:hypothetical protein JKP88DRAFT_263286 [Tribonema minus]|uniref:FAD-binding domain-containing protein n=1 Tax=Tribonema minus TaxID=303371 RepID=A0A836CFQ4_9STRA|nr:hypothetical protein JKP88DRAFT_263286 [Tribonema minus]